MLFLATQILETAVNGMFKCSKSAKMQNNFVLESMLLQIATSWTPQSWKTDFPHLGSGPSGEFKVIEKHKNS